MEKEARENWGSGYDDKTVTYVEDPRNPSDTDGQPVREFSTFTDDLERLTEWLIACGFTAVAMESSGIYEILPQNTPSTGRGILRSGGKGDATPLIKYFEMPRPVGRVIHWIPVFEILEAKYFASGLGLSPGTKVRRGINYV